MCNGFGAIVTSDLQIRFIEPDSEGDISHSEILERMGWNDNRDPFTRRFVRVECPDWKIDSFHFDEAGTLPGWAEENADTIREQVGRLLEKAAPAYVEYQRVTAPAYAEYQRVTAAAYAEYQRVTAAAEAEMISTLSKLPGYVPA